MGMGRAGNRRRHQGIEGAAMTAIIVGILGWWVFCVVCWFTPGWRDAGWGTDLGGERVYYEVATLKHTVCVALIGSVYWGGAGYFIWAIG